MDRSRPGSSMPPDSGYAEPPHHRTAPARYWYRPTYNARIGLDDSSLLARAPRAWGQRHARTTRRFARAYGRLAFGSDHGARSDAHHRTRGARTRANDDFDRRTRRRSQAGRSPLVRLSQIS